MRTKDILISIKNEINEELAKAKEWLKQHPDSVGEIGYVDGIEYSIGCIIAKLEELK